VVALSSPRPAVVVWLAPEEKPHPVGPVGVLRSRGGEAACVGLLALALCPLRALAHHDL
jgi:hypothetical protein